MEWASALASDEHFSRAFDAAADEIIRQLSVPPNLLIAFVSHDYADEMEQLSDMVAATFPGCLLIGCSAGGVIGAGREIENQPALSFLAGILPGVELTPFHWVDVPRISETCSEEDVKSIWRDRVGIASEREPAFLVFTDPFTCDAQSMLAGLDAVYPNACKLGGMLSGSKRPGKGRLFIGNDQHREGAVAIALRGNFKMESVVAQGCKPIGEKFIVTKFEDNVIHEFNRGRPVDVLRDVYQTLDCHDQNLAEHSLFVGIELTAKSRGGLLTDGDFLMRHALSFDPKDGTMTVDGPLEDHQVIQFHVRDRSTSSEDLDDVLAHYQQTHEGSPAAALMISCLGRGADLYGTSDHDSSAFLNRFGDVPICGFFGNGEIGAVGGKAFVHGYSSSFGMIRPRSE
jgi:small ligand-binding sensory domain FIST